jgi:hypothetical protein
MHSPFEPCQKIHAIGRRPFFGVTWCVTGALRTACVLPALKKSPQLPPRGCEWPQMPAEP